MAMYSHWPCPYCFKDQESPEKLKDHLSLAKPRCGKETPATNSNKDNNRSWECPDCRQNYPLKNSLLRHYHWHIVCALTCLCGKTLLNLRSLELHLDKCQVVQSPDQGSRARAYQMQGEKLKLRKQASAQLASAFEKRQHSPTHPECGKKRKISGLVAKGKSFPQNFCQFMFQARS
ncbi:hypothetical protein BJY01DRAFT_16086 [Aspergillus pseudoustus]|uniref:C2H2-type domain-containing protein n=1 Tax=Aspergillus pseudoustus TaxID=1810923 RepID=A0ABR4JL85_9EURO